MPPQSLPMLGSNASNRARLEALRDERDYVRIKISLLADDDAQKAEKLAALLKELSRLDREILPLESVARQGGYCAGSPY